MSLYNITEFRVGTKILSAKHSNQFKNVPDISTLMYNTSENENAIFHGEEC